MTDVHTPEQRSRNMAGIRGKNTKPEMLVRSLLHRLGYRFRLHRKDLPGKPDIVFPSRRKVLFVHGCYWHMHDCRWGRVVPATNTDFWQTKRKGNCERDEKAQQALKTMGWSSHIVWECDLKNEDMLIMALRGFLDETA
jgi:DNA mismatch endonuclease (patch repair protein)